MLYIGQAVSQLGDWFNAVAVYTLILELGGSATAVAWMLIIQFLPAAIVGPMAGVVVDRVNRRRLMMATDIARGMLVLGLLLIRRPDQIWIAYLVMSLSVSAQAFFEPARTATIPNVTSREELMPANALSSATWSVMLAVGASVGGLVTAIAGRNAAFVINALSFFVSAFFISRTRFDASRAAPQQNRGLAVAGLSDLAEGFRYVRRHSRLAAVVLVKAGWGLAGGILLLLTIFGQRVFPVGDSTAAGIGTLYGARGIGAALGPIALRWVFGQSPQTLRRSIGPAYFVVGAFYVAFGGAPNLAVAALCVLCAHFGGSILWVFSTVLLQLEVPDRLRGRVFALELAAATLTFSLSSYWTAYQLDSAGMDPRTMAVVLGLLFVVPGSAWLLMESDRQEPARTARPPASPAPDPEVLEDRLH
jgi:MFS family permease